MAKTVLISCVSKKLDRKSKAQELYVSPLFRKNLQYAKSLNPDHIFFLSAQYGLLVLNKEIESYVKTLNKMSNAEIKEWANSVFTQLQNVSDVNRDDSIFLAGIKYRKFLLPHIRNYEVPMLGLGIGKQLEWLTGKIKHE